METSVRKFWKLPHPLLRPFVDRYWGWEADTACVLPTLLPGTGAEIIFHRSTPFMLAPGTPAGYRAPQAHLGYMRRRPLRLGADGPFSFIAVRVRSGALRHLCPFPLSEDMDGIIPLEDIWGRDAAWISARLSETGNANTWAMVLDLWLIACLGRHIRPDTLIDQAVEQLYYRHAETRIESLATQHDLSVRQFERRFRAAIGRSPKSFQRAARFHQTIRDLMLTGGCDYLDLALAHGYYDQAHFIHEFSAFVGDTPTRFLNDETAMSHFYNPSLKTRPKLATP